MEIYEIPHSCQKKSTVSTILCYNELPDRCIIQPLVHLYLQCRLAIWRKFEFLSLISQTPCLQYCSVYIYIHYAIEMWVGASSSVRGRREGRGRITLRWVTLNSCFRLQTLWLRRSWILNMAPAHCLKKIIYYEICNTGRYRFICESRGIRGWGKGLRGMRYHKAPGVLGFYVIMTQTKG